MSRGRRPGVNGIGYFGKWLEQNLKREALSCQKVADTLRISRAIVQYHIRHKSKPTFINIIGYCYLFGGDPNEVWNLVEADWGE